MMNLQADRSRYFMVPKGDQFEEVGLCARAVDGLVKMNGPLCGRETRFDFSKGTPDWTLHTKKYQRKCKY